MTYSCFHNVYQKYLIICSEPASLKLDCDCVSTGFLISHHNTTVICVFYYYYYYLISLQTQSYEMCVMFWWKGSTGPALKGQSRLYRHSRRLCNGRFDQDTVFPDKGISIQNRGWHTARESSTEGKLVPIGTGNKQGAEGVKLIPRCVLVGRRCEVKMVLDKLIK